MAAAAHKKDDGDAEAAAPRMLGTRGFKTALRRAVTLSVAKRVARQMPWQIQKNRARREEKASAEAKSFAELGAWEKFCFVTDWPFVLVRKLTILPCQPGEYDKHLTIAWPYAGIMATQMICTKSWPLHWGYACYLPVAVGWSVLFYCIKGTRSYVPADEEEAKAKAEEEEKAAEAPAAALSGAFAKL